MSAQYGRWNFDGADATPSEQMRALLSPYGPDGESLYSDRGIAVVFRAFSTTEEPALERQPLISPSGAVITWDGRLDNREELVSALDGFASRAESDAAIVGAAYERWKAGCFGRLVGDWAVSIWNPDERSLLLARDFVGAKHLYYSMERNTVRWSTTLNLLVTGRDLTLDEEYIAGWISSYPRSHLTPYTEVHSVPPACFLRFTPEGHVLKKYWEFDGTKRIRYRSDSEFEEHFLALFEQSVRRRIRSNTPVLAELSGGMDSTAIVSMVDRVTAHSSGTPRIDTVSYYDDSEPNWDERPFFAKIEERRGRTGLHVNVGAPPLEETSDDDMMFWPGSRRRPSIMVEWMSCHGHRILLSGIGGDEVLGGVPTPIPELEDLLARAKFAALAHRLKVWALVQRKPWIYLFHDAVTGFLPPMLRLVPEHKRPAFWLQPAFTRHHRVALSNLDGRWRIFGALPSFQENLSALDRLQRQLAATELCAEHSYEKRYPFLDRDLLEFLYAIPREQLVRPSERRSLMRRALRGIVPDEILNRKRKAYVTRSPLAVIARQREQLMTSRSGLIAGSLGIINSEAFFNALDAARQGKQVPLVPLLRALSLERWLQSLKTHGDLKGFSVSIASSTSVLSKAKPKPSTHSSEFVIANTQGA
jgi:asparagine synthase (glutamine-hydrolysing)